MDGTYKECCYPKYPQRKVMRICKFCPTQAFLFANSAQHTILGFSKPVSNKSAMPTSCLPANLNPLNFEGFLEKSWLNYFIICLKAILNVGQNLQMKSALLSFLDTLIGSVFGWDEIYAAFEFSRSRGALNCKQNASKALLRDRVA